MILRKHLLISIFFFPMLFFAQDEMQFMGFIKLNDSSVIPYEIEFKIDAGKLEGFSLTDFGGAHETRSKLIGKYDPHKKEIQFNEYDIVYTKSDVIQDDFCYVYFNPVRYKEGSTSHFKGEFEGFFSDGQACLNGEIYLNSSEKVEKRVEKVKRLIQKSGKLNDSIKEKANRLKILNKDKSNVLRNNQVTTLYTNENFITLNLFDGGKQDGDVISIDVNNKRIMTKFTVTKTPKFIEIPINSEKINIKIISVSTGSIDTNTAVIEVNNGNRDFTAITNLEKGEFSTLQIIKK